MSKFFGPIKHAFVHCLRPEPPQRNDSYCRVCKMRILIAMSLLLFILYCSPLKQAKIKRGGLDSRDDDNYPKPIMCHSRHSPSPMTPTPIPRLADAGSTASLPENSTALATFNGYLSYYCDVFGPGRSLRA
ncbi:hypothetical protein EDB89DRAFT_2065726 [Lactarius sanguifluus]|nr:hypothetical protein EDB89DRAFT_2065726 [Lactarius sanguifluus]